MTNRAGFAPGDAKEDWAILRALSDVLGHELPFDSLAAACARSSMPTIRISRRIDAIAPADAGRSRAAGRASAADSSKAAFASPVKDFYLTNPIARASAVMAECSALAKDGFKQAAE